MIGERKDINGLNVVAIKDDGYKDNCRLCVFDSYCNPICPVRICSIYSDGKEHYIHDWKEFNNQQATLSSTGGQ